MGKSTASSKRQTDLPLDRSIWDWLEQSGSFPGITGFSAIASHNPPFCRRHGQLSIFSDSGFPVRDHAETRTILESLGILLSAHGPSRASNVLHPWHHHAAS